MLHSKLNKSNRIDNRENIRVFSLGGCNLLQLSKYFEPISYTKHFWRCTIPSLVSPPVTLRNKHLNLPEATQFLVRESEKHIWNEIVLERPDVILFEAAGDFHTRHLRIGDTIIPDLRSEIFGAGWNELTYGEIPELTKADILDCNEESYWRLWLEYLENFVGRLRDADLGNCQLIILARAVNTHYLDAGLVQPFVNQDWLVKTNNRLARLYEDIENVEGVQMVRPDPSLWLSSEAAPFGRGEWHPNEAAYLDVFRRVAATIRLNTCRTERAVSLGLENLARGRSAAEAGRILAEQQRDHARAEVANLQSILATEQAGRISAEQQRDLACAEIVNFHNTILTEEARHQELIASLRVENERLRARNDDSNALLLALVVQDLAEKKGYLFFRSNEMKMHLDLVNGAPWPKELPLQSGAELLLEGWQSQNGDSSNIEFIAISDRDVIRGRTDRVHRPDVSRYLGESDQKLFGFRVYFKELQQSSEYRLFFFTHAMGKVRFKFIRKLFTAATTD